MRRRLLIFRGLAYYWRTNAAVVCGVAAAVSVLAGALVVGDSVRATLRDLALQRLGRTDMVVTSPRFFREELADALRGDPDFSAILLDVCPLIALEGVVTAQTSGLRAGRVLVYGVDDRFWRFHGVTGTDGPADRQAFVSPALAADTGLAAGGVALVRVALPSDVPLESVQGRKDALGRTLRLTVARVLSADRSRRVCPSSLSRGGPRHLRAAAAAPDGNRDWPPCEPDAGVRAAFGALPHQPRSNVC